MARWGLLSLVDNVKLSGDMESEAFLYTTILLYQVFTFYTCNTFLYKTFIGLSTRGRCLSGFVSFKSKP